MGEMHTPKSLCQNFFYRGLIFTHLITIVTSVILNWKCQLHTLEEEIDARWVSTTTSLILMGSLTGWYKRRPQQNVDYFQIFLKKCPPASDYFFYKGPAVHLLIGEFDGQKHAIFVDHLQASKINWLSSRVRKQSKMVFAASSWTTITRAAAYAGM